jgi:histidyl-tRNA synthetase
MKLVAELRAAGIKSDFLAKDKAKLQAQFTAGERDEVPFAVILGSDELKAGLVTVKEQRWELKDGQKVKIQNDDRGQQVERAKLIDWLKKTETYQGWETGKWA